ncbi:MAG TPA: hypothetical protein PLT07_11975, partial [Trueperaceae bacterium]|nr:hypothetical protein [Trueperaceae bacterium]
SADQLGDRPAEALHGLVECLERLGRQDEADVFRPRLALAVARADVAIGSSCFCRLEEAPAAGGHCCH